MNVSLSGELSSEEDKPKRSIFDLGFLRKKKEPLLDELDMEQIKKTYHEKLKEATLAQVKIQAAEKATEQAKLEAARIVYGKKGDPKTPKSPGNLGKIINKFAQAGGNVMTNMESSYYGQAPAKKKKRESSFTPIEDDFS